MSIRAITLIILLLLIEVGGGCAKLFGNLRRDLDDSSYVYSSQPTVGGRWAERDLLSDDLDHYSAVGHTERSPASQQTDYGGGSGSWVSTESDIEQLDDPQKMLKEVSPPRAKKADFIDDSPNEGSLWASSGQTNYYFSKNKTRGIGDIVTINIEQELLKDVLAEVTRTLSHQEKDIEITAAQERLRVKTLGIKDSKKEGQVAGTEEGGGRAPASAAAPSQSADDLNVPTATAQDIDVSKVLEIKAGDTVLGEILERFPNGNYKVRGTKRIQFRNAPRLLTLIGIVKGTDISEEDILSSGRIYEYRLEVFHP